MIAVGATADLNEDPTDFEYVKSTICHALKDEEFENMLLETASDESFEVNQKAVDRYAPSKLKMVNESEMEKKNVLQQEDIFYGFAKKNMNESLNFFQLCSTTVLFYDIIIGKC